MPALEEVSDPVVRWVAEHVEPVSFPAGATLIVEDDVDRDCYFLVSGLTEVTLDGARLGESGAGEAEGHMAMFFDRPRNGTITAVEPVEALRLSSTAFDDLRQRDPAAADELKKGILKHLARRWSW